MKWFGILLIKTLILFVFMSLGTFAGKEAANYCELNGAIVELIALIGCIVGLQLHFKLSATYRWFDIFYNKEFDDE